MKNETLYTFAYVSELLVILLLAIFVHWGFGLIILLINYKIKNK